MSNQDIGDPHENTAVQDWHAISVSTAARELATDPASGLTRAEAERRLAVHGPNEIVQHAVISPLAIFARQFSSVVIWVLILAAVTSAILGDVVDATAIVAIVLLNSAIGFLQEYRSETAVAQLRKMTAPRARVLRDGKAMTVPASALVPGDLLLVDAGDLIAADARVVEAAALETNEAALTGESAPVEKSAAECASLTPLVERSSMLFLGTAVTRGTGRAIVVATGMRTEFGRIAQLLESASSEATPLQRRLDRVAHRLLWLCLGIVAIVSVLGLLRSTPAFEIFLGAVSLAVAAIPEGLPAIVTVALALGVGRMARRNALVRRLHSVETLGCAQVICTDKTGTLTMGEMTARRIVTAEGIFNVTGEGYSTDGAIFGADEAGSGGDPILRELLMAAVACNDAHLTRSDDGKFTIIGDPTEGALLVLAAKGGISVEEIEAEMPRLAAIPFASERKLMTVIRKTSRGPLAFVKGAPEAVLERCTRVCLRDGNRLMKATDRARLQEASSLLAGEALRVIACAQRSIAEPMDAREMSKAATIERDLDFLGLIGMLDPPRAEAREAVDKCRRAGILTVMITGDHPDTAAAIARDLGILRPGQRTLNGPELERIGDDELRRVVADISVYSRVTAEHKLRIVRAWKAQGATVAMTGDGVNDAPALKEAAIGIAMGVTGTEVTKQAADIVITDDNFASIVAAVEEGRGIYDNIVKTLLYLMGGNFGELAVMLMAAIAGWPLPLLPTQLLWINLVTDGLPALALVTDPIDQDVLLQPPRSPDSDIIDVGFMGWAALTGCLTAAVTLAAFGWTMHVGAGLPRGRNVAFLVLVIAELMRSFGARSATKTLWEIGILSNLRLFAVVLASLALQLVISATPLLESIFDTEPVTGSQFGAGILLGLVPLVILQSIKGLRRRASRRSPTS
jgi:P-type Ca2+ transporter type 2C